ncbi:MAG: 16S rRNA (adenine(1518)-N(6)/adenine(1519)-N(6))-dimethyltransferase RsmA [Candidatus Brocadiia bacterium]
MKSALIQLLLKKNIFVTRRLGQNFLIDPNFFDYIIRTAGISGLDDVIEIGSGPGILTGLLSQQARSVTAVEIDQKLVSLAQESLSGRTNVRFINDDILDKPRTGINAQVIRQLDSGAGYKIVSNLPYKTAVPIIMTLLESRLADGGLKIKSMLVMVQWEVAERLVASVGTAQYGSVSVRAQYLADIKIERKVPPEVFYPKPKVQSAMISIVPKDGVDAALYHGLKKLSSAVFNYRRKTVRSALKQSAVVDGWVVNAVRHPAVAGKEDIEKMLSQAGINGETRPQDIPLSGYLDLCRSITL